MISMSVAGRRYLCFIRAFTKCICVLSSLLYRKQLVSTILLSKWLETPRVQDIESNRGASRFVDFG